jgi:hypothetical protein
MQVEPRESPSAGEDRPRLGTLAGLRSRIGGEVRPAEPVDEIWLEDDVDGPEEPEP